MKVNINSHLLAADNIETFVLNLANSNNGIRGRVTLPEIEEDAPYAPVTPSNESREELKNFEQEPNHQEDRNGRNPTRSSVILWCGYTWFMIVYFFFDHFIQSLRTSLIYLTFRIHRDCHITFKNVDRSSFWFPEGFRHLHGQLHEWAVHSCSNLEHPDHIRVRSYDSSWKYVHCLTHIVFSLIDLDCCEPVQEFLSMIIFEYFFFGFFSIPIMKMLLQTYDWVVIQDYGRVLRRNHDWSKNNFSIDIL